MSKTFLFYDLETSGLNKTFDQVLQFAAIRTDLNLNEIERHEIWVRLSPDTVPSPSALLTHRVSIQQMLNEGLTEVEAIRKIHQLINTPETISIGYNNLKFDDEFLRFSFYRNLLPPYTHQFANGCGRADLYPMIIFYYLYKNEVLLWPEINNKISLKLEYLNTSNQLTRGKAHHALSDVETTIALAKYCQRHSDIWNYLLHFFDKNKVAESLTKLHTTLPSGQKEALLIDAGFGITRNYQCPVLLLGHHRHYKNKLVWLRLDKGSFDEITPENIGEKSKSHFCKPGEDNFVLPLQSHYNKLSNEQQLTLEQNKLFLSQQPAFIGTLAQYHLHYKYPQIPNLDPAAALYDMGFFTDYENFLCREFHNTPPAQQHYIVEKFTNPIIRELAIRLIGRNYPEHLPEKYQEIYTQYLNINYVEDSQKSLLNYRGEEKLTVQKAMNEIQNMKSKSLNDEDIKLLIDLENYLLK